VSSDQADLGPLYFKDIELYNVSSPRNNLEYIVPNPVGVDPVYNGRRLSGSAKVNMGVIRSKGRNRRAAVMISNDGIPHSLSPMARWVVLWGISPADVARILKQAITHQGKGRARRAVAFEWEQRQYLCRY
jgi:hypothetical protein